jgi:hypothetical protein
MPKLLLPVLLGLVLSARTAPATVLSISGQSCVGENTPSCPGGIDMFSGAPGTFFAGAIAQVSGDFPPFNVQSAGTITSGVFRRTGTILLPTEIPEPEPSWLTAIGLLVLAVTILVSGLRRSPGIRRFNPWRRRWGEWGIVSKFPLPRRK